MNKHNVKEWLSLSSPIVAVLICLYLNVLSTEALVWLLVIGVLLLINIFAPRRHAGWSVRSNENAHKFAKEVSAYHGVITCILITTSFVLVLQQAGCTKLPGWFDEKFDAFSREHSFRDDAYLVENRASHPSSSQALSGRG